MRTPRRHRLTRRQSEQLLDGTLDSSGGYDDLARLLADATPARVDGELPGEAAALAAFRSAAVADLDPEPRSRPVPALSLTRSLAFKVVAVAAAGVTVGGAAVAATGHLPGTGRTSPTASSTPLHTPTPTGTGSHGTPTADPQRTGTPTGTPSRRDDVRTVGLCRAWGEVTAHDAAAAARSARFRDLTTQAGGADKVPGFCAQYTYAWCEHHGWPASTSVQVDGRQQTVRCARPATGKPNAGPSGTPSGGPANGGGAGNGGSNGTASPTHAPTPSGRSAGQPSGGPVTD